MTKIVIIVLLVAAAVVWVGLRIAAARGRLRRIEARWALERWHAHDPNTPGDQI